LGDVFSGDEETRSEVMETPRWTLGMEDGSKPQPANDAAKIFDLEVENAALKSALHQEVLARAMAERKLDAWIETWRAELRAREAGIL
jgi:hypothetical protein